MPLDLIRIATQVSGMIARLKDSRSDRQKHLQCALDTLCGGTIDLNDLKRKMASAKTTWLVAGFTDSLDRHYPAPPLPPEFSVIATDGSQIDVDRHRSARCYLLNTGSAVIRYGARPDASLESIPRLYSSEEDLVIAPPRPGLRPQAIEGPLLGIKRGVEECRRLVELAAQLPAGSDSLAVLDGSLILWSLEPYPEFVTEALLHKGFLACLEDLRKLNSDRRLAVASYISFTGSTDVVNTLRVALCPHEPVDCDRCEARECDVVAGVRDRELFSGVLAEGERSDLFISQSSIVRKHYGAHETCFFYLNTDNEIARVEVPRWVAQDESRINLCHALLLDQCRRGQGYPVALSEAHEQAVVTAADRDNFWQLVESSLVDERMTAVCSAKSFSKRTRWV